MRRHRVTMVKGGNRYQLNWFFICDHLRHLWIKNIMGINSSDKTMISPTPEEVAKNFFRRNAPALKTTTGPSAADLNGSPTP